ncbi:FHA domain-containing protein [Wenzhouxiangella sp. EGI_FJ10305]|uniref:FHA domain-containing protein n=1 Tax=Wenzhouxiangella sp. EGI_FJ10305 TaxID=3243768 RepID=UPI0035E1004A
MLSLLLAVTQSLPAQASDWNTLVVGDINDDALPASHPAWRRADRAITQALINRGFDVFDKSALGLVRDCAGEACEGYSQTDFIRLARDLNRTADDPVDLMVVYSVIVTSRSGAAIDRFQVRLPGKMVDIGTGRIVDQWDGGLLEFVDPSENCQGPCLRQWQADRARESGQELGAVLAEKLAAYVREYNFRIELQRFTPGEREAILAGLRAAPDYRSGALEELGSGSRTREWLHQRVSGTYELATPLAVGALRERIESLIVEAGASGSVRVRGSRLEVERQGFPYAGRYTAMFLTPFVLLLLFVLWWRYSRYDEVAVELERRDRPGEGLAFLDQPPVPLLPRRPRWEALRSQWQERMAAADANVAEARAALEQRDFERCASLLEQALEQAGDHAAALSLQERLHAIVEADALLAKAKDNVDADPARASKLLIRARELDDSLSGEVETLLATAEEKLRNTVLAKHIETAAIALDEQQWLRAASQAGLGLASIGGLDHFADERAHLERLRDQAVAGIRALQGNARGTGELKDAWLLTGDEIALGRAHGLVAGSITMNYKRMSRLGKQAVIRREGRRLYIVDQGSTHGTMADDQLLANGQPRRLANKTMLALGGGRDPARAGPARLLVEVPEGCPSSAIARLDRFHLKTLSSDDLAVAWPTMDEGLKRVWLLVRDGVPLHGDGKRVQPGIPEEDHPVVLLGHDNGYWVAPCGEEIDERVRLDGEVLSTRIPLSAGSTVTLGDCSMGLEEWR